MWYDDECLYIYKKTLKNILKQNDMVSDLFNKVKKELKNERLIKTESRKKDKNSTTEYSIKMPTRFKGDKDGKSAVCFYRAKCRDKGYFCKTLKKLESMSENA